MPNSQWVRWLKKKADVHWETMKTFDRDERYVVAYYTSSRTHSAWLSWLLVRSMMALFFIFGMSLSDQAILFAAFGGLFLMDLYGQWRQPRYTRILRSALDKLEGRIEELEGQLSAGSVVTLTSLPPADSGRQ